MDEALLNLLHKEYKIGKIKLTFLHLLFLAGITFTAMMMRYTLRDNSTWDYHSNLKVWIDEMRAMGGFKGLSGSFYNYTPPYVLLILILSYLPMNTMYAIKLVSVIFDVAMAVIAARVVFNMTGSRTRAAGIYGIILLVPTIANNSAFWGQCDVIYTTMILLTAYYIMNDKPAKGMFFYGIAFALKLQSVFILPALIVLWALKKIELKHFLFMPLMYVIGILPAVIAGRPILECLLIYAGQSAESPQLSLGYPNIYQLLGTTDFLDVYAPAGIWLTIAVLMVFMYFAVKNRPAVTKAYILQLFMMSELITVCFLPFMHERYGYVLDVLTVIYAFIYLKKFYIPLLQILLSFSAYSIILSAYVNVPLPLYSFVTIFLLFDIGYSVYRHSTEQINRPAGQAG